MYRSHGNCNPDGILLHTQPVSYTHLINSLSGLNGEGPALMYFSGSAGNHCTFQFWMPQLIQNCGVPFWMSPILSLVIRKMG